MKRIREPRTLPPRPPRPGSMAVRLTAAAATFTRSFTADDLAVRAWEMYRGVFGLRGHPEHPSNQAVRVLLCHRYGPVARGWLARVAHGRYTVTDAGREVARLAQPREDVA